MLCLLPQPDLLNFKKGWMSKLDEKGEVLTVSVYLSISSLLNLLFVNSYLFLFDHSVCLLSLPFFSISHCWN